MKDYSKEAKSTQNFIKDFLLEFSSINIIVVGFLTRND